MLPHEFQNLLEKFSRGTCTPEEEQLIINWYNNIGQSPSEKEILREDERGELQEKLWSAINPNPSHKRKWLPYLTRAAIITIPLLAGAVFYFTRHTLDEFVFPRQEAFINPGESDFANEGKTILRIPLPDGSQVVLQPSSEIILAKDYGKTSRELKLKGEAFFQVKPDAQKPFVVYSNEVVTRVLGTSFNVRAYENDGEITVAVKTGKVSVYASKNKATGLGAGEEHREIILTPNQQIVYYREREKVSKQLVKKPEVILPNSNLFRMQFENEPVSTIFQVLEENYGIEIRYDRDLIRNCRLTTSMSDEGLYERIEVICKAIGASYEIDDDAAITIKSNGCLN